MGGGWAGYVFSMLGCGLFVALIAGSTLFLYGVARIRRDGHRGPRVTVRSVSSGPSTPAVSPPVEP